MDIVQKRPKKQMRRQEWRITKQKSNSQSENSKSFHATVMARVLVSHWVSAFYLVHPCDPALKKADLGFRISCLPEIRNGNPSFTNEQGRSRLLAIRNFIYSGTQSQRVAADVSAGTFTSGEVDFSPPEMTALASEVFA